MVVAYHYYNGHVKSNTNYMKLSHKVMIIRAFYGCGLCWRHTVPKLTPDGHTIKEMFYFGSDRENIGTFVRTS